MHIVETYITHDAQCLLDRNRSADCAYREVIDAICNMTDVINCTEKNCNGVVPLKEPCYQMLEEEYGWYREKPLSILTKKGGPIDVYKAFGSGADAFRVGVEFETGNAASPHRSMNKLLLGIRNREIDLAILMMPMHRLSYYLTDRAANYEELYPYFQLTSGYPFVFIGFDVEEYTTNTPRLPKGSDGMSHRSIRKWRNR